MKILVLGIGNVLMGDEGAGVHAIRELEKQTWPENVHILDGGTGGFHLLEYLQHYKKIIMIDATMDGQPPGTLRLIKPRFSSDFPKALSAHDIGLKDLVESAAILNHMPDVHLITVSIETVQPMRLDLSPEIQNVLPEITKSVKDILLSLDETSSVA
ncbi:HyaD/HybD family hydrogenase maturation endopeptidase [bacterium]|nr:HyaD/HybD family hydrogenase maturation endopeptidase [bacterium]